VKRTFRSPLYHAKVHLFWETPNDTYIRSLRRIAAEDPGDPDPDAAGMFWSFSERKTGRKVYSLWIEKTPKRPKEIGFLCHEVFHLTVEILRDVGLRWGAGASEEAFVYLFQSLLETILDKMERRVTTR